MKTGGNLACNELVTSADSHVSALERGGDAGFFHLLVEGQQLFKLSMRVAHLDQGCERIGQRLHLRHSLGHVFMYLHGLREIKVCIAGKCAVEGIVGSQGRIDRVFLHLFVQRKGLSSIL